MDSKTPPVCNYEGSQYQKDFWDEGGRAYEDAVEAIALKRLLPQSGKFMLELGAGAGRNTPRYRNYERVALVDYSRTQLEQARDRLGDDPQYLYVAADIYKLPFVDGRFDGATMIRTLHHMADPVLALSQVRRAMVPGGIFILEFANKRNLKAILRYLLGKQDWSPYTQEPVEFAELNFDFHPRVVRRYLDQVDFKVLNQLSVSHFRVGFFKRHIPLRVLQTLDALLQPTGRIIQVSPSVFSKCKAVGESPAAEDDQLFQCPECSAALPGGEQDQLCPDCGKVYEYRDGIYDFRID
ncbi:MAG TPA: class I SAM-dependent methyltransferase [Brevefilum sp.]